MRVRLDRELCTGHGRCYSLAPDVFGEDERGHCVLKRSTTLPEELEEQARIGAESCPEEALSLED